MMMRGGYEVIIVGMGAMGSAAAYHLAKRGKRVLGFDRFAPPHTLGSSHGKTRIIREAYFEHPLYVPLIQRAYELWAELESESGDKLFRQTGGLMMGRPDSVVVAGARRSAEEHRLRHELLSAHDVRLRFPAFHPADDMIAVWGPRAGILFPERCVEAHLASARRRGAELAFDEPVLRWQPDGDGVRVFTTKGEYQTDQLLFTTGSWLTLFIAELRLPLTVERQIQFWFEPRNPAWFQPDRCPIHIWEHEPGKYFYGFPDLGDGVKV
ncbi:MAG TPA: N-methyl-L-tryptophan oxidase, partial [Verrucomicrobiae bacterium]|nr:N-methyl-L-tryptophan oxidase [Verrucomicrobiae bacterium]